eukprot:Pgem_evm1s595
MNGGGRGVATGKRREKPSNRDEFETFKNVRSNFNWNFIEKLETRKKKEYHFKI